MMLIAAACHAFQAFLVSIERFGSQHDLMNACSCAAPQLHLAYRASLPLQACM